MPFFQPRNKFKHHRSAMCTQSDRSDCLLVCNLYPTHQAYIASSNTYLSLTHLKFPKYVPKPLFTSLSVQPLSSVGGAQNLRTEGRWFDSRARPIFFSRIDSHGDRIHSFLTTFKCFDNGYVGKQPVAREAYCTEYWLKELQESMDRYTGRRYVTEILLKRRESPYNQSLNIPI